MTAEPVSTPPERRGPGRRSVAARPRSGASTRSSKRPPEPAPVPEDAAAVAVLEDAPAAEDAAPVADASATEETPAGPAQEAPGVRRPAGRRLAVRQPHRASVLPAASDLALSVRDLTKTFGPVVAVDSVDLEVHAGQMFGFVGPNGAGKTTTLSMITGLLRPDSGVIRVYGADVWRNAAVAKKSIGVLPDRLRLFDRLTGAEFLHHAGALRGLDRDTVALRVEDLAAAFGLERALHRPVSDYSAGMVKKISIAAAMIHSPRLLVLDEPFESVDPVSAAAVIGILRKFTAAGGTVLLSSHSMGLIERVCDSVAVIAQGRMLASGPLDEVRDGLSLEARFVELAGGATAVAGMEWLQSYTD